MTVGPERIAYVNPGSGAGSDGPDPLVDVLRARGFEIDDSVPDDFAGSIAQRIRDGATIICAVGGDGTHRSTAPAVAGTDAAFLPAPGGTWNHFAKDCGIPDAEALARAVDAPRPLDVPIATVNGEAFLNTAVVGWYPEMVRTREDLRTKMPRPLAAVLALARHVPRLHRFYVTVDGTTGPAWLVWVGNGTYGTGATDIAQREDVTAAMCDVRVAWAASRLPRMRLVWDLVRGRLKQSALMERVATDEAFTLRIDRTHLDAALDAEVVRLVPPLSFRPAAARVRVLGAPEAPSPG